MKYSEKNVTTQNKQPYSIVPGPSMAVRPSVPKLVDDSNRIYPINRILPINIIFHTNRKISIIIESFLSIEIHKIP